MLAVRSRVGETVRYRRNNLMGFGVAVKFCAVMAQLAGIQN